MAIPIFCRFCINVRWILYPLEDSNCIKYVALFSPVGSTRRGERSSRSLIASNKSVATIFHPEVDLPLYLYLPSLSLLLPFFSFLVLFPLLALFSSFLPLLSFAQIQLGGLESAVSFPSGVWGRSPAAARKRILAHLRMSKRILRPVVYVQPNDFFVNLSSEKKIQTVIGKAV